MSLGKQEAKQINMYKNILGKPETYDEETKERLKQINQDYSKVHEMLENNISDFKLFDTSILEKDVIFIRKTFFNFFIGTTIKNITTFVKQMHYVWKSFLKTRIFCMFNVNRPTLVKLVHNLVQFK